MRAGKGNQEEDEYEEEEFSSRKDVSFSVQNINNSIKDAKAIDKASATRSKHSVTEQRRRSKINERFQILRNLIPHSDQKRDTASFLLEVIEYVQFLQEKVQKYEGSYQDWSNEPTKLMPWRNSHWRVQSFVDQPQAVKNGSGSVLPFPGMLDEKNITISPTVLSGTQNMLDPEPSRDVASKAVERQPELASKGVSLPMPAHANIPVPGGSDGALAHPLQAPVSNVQSTEFPVANESQKQDEMTIEGGTITISSVYSQGLLNNLTQALQSAGLDLSQASISVQINLGKQANIEPSSETSAPKNHVHPPLSNQATAHLRDASTGEDSDQAHKRLKT